MLIRYRNGLMVEGILLSLAGGRMRVALKDAEDFVEFRLIKDVWISEDGEPVTFDFTMTILAAAGIVPPADTRSGERVAGLRSTRSELPSASFDRCN